jgi:hypothetical protein
VGEVERTIRRVRSDELVLRARTDDVTAGMVANVVVEVVASVVVRTARGAGPLVRAVSPVARPVAGIVLRPPWIDRRFWPETQLHRYAERGRARTQAVQRSAAELGRTGIPALVNAVLDQLDLTRLVRERVDLDEVVASVDIDRIVKTVDIDAIAARLDLDAVAARLDVDAVAKRIDVEAIVGRVDVDSIAGRVDVAAVVDRVDILGIARYVVDALDVAGIVRESTGVLASETVSGVRMRAVDADERVGRIIGRLLGRPGGQGFPSAEPQ